MAFQVKRRDVKKRAISHSASQFLIGAWFEKQVARPDAEIS
jgi:hypothetical protein